MANQQAILKQIEKTKAAAHVFLEESMVLESLLGEVSTSPTTRKGKYQKTANKLVARRNATMLLKTR
jgi:hypothetical protein